MPLCMTPTRTFLFLKQFRTPWKMLCPFKFLKGFWKYIKKDLKNVSYIFLYSPGQYFCVPTSDQNNLVLSFLVLSDTPLSPSYLSNPLPFSHWQLLINSLPLNTLSHPLQRAQSSWSSTTRNHSLAGCIWKESWAPLQVSGYHLCQSLSTRDRAMTGLSALLTFHVWSLMGGKNWFLSDAAFPPHLKWPAQVQYRENCSTSRSWWARVRAQQRQMWPQGTPSCPCCIEWPGNSFCFETIKMNFMETSEHS